MNKKTLVAVAIVLSVGVAGAETIRTAALNDSPLRTQKLDTSGIPASPAASSLSREQREVVRKSVDRRWAKPENIAVELGAKVPRTVELYSFSDAAYMHGGMARPYMYFRTAHQIVLVDPQEKQVIEIVKD